MAYTFRNNNQSYHSIELNELNIVLQFANILNQIIEINLRACLGRKYA
jgi:hypothetical protein